MIAGWIGRHRWGLIALVVLVPSAILAALSVQWFWYNGNQAQFPVTVAAGETGVSQRTEFTLTDYVVVPWDSESGRDVALLEGTEAVSALIHVDATDSPATDDKPIGCDAVLVAPGPDGDRIWSAGSSALDYYPSGDLEAFCMLSDHEEYDWEAVFVVPEGIGDEARLLVTDGGLFEKQLLVLEH